MDMAAEERVLMQEHARYTRESVDARKMLLYGSVTLLARAFEMPVFEVADEAEVRAVLENAPTLLAGLNKFEIHPMRVGAAQGFGA
jgi:hypothetical protein